MLLMAFCIRRRRIARDKDGLMTTEQFQALKERIIERCGEDDAYCKKGIKAQLINIVSFYL